MAALDSSPVFEDMKSRDDVAELLRAESEGE